MSGSELPEKEVRKKRGIASKAKKNAPKHCMGMLLEIANGGLITDIPSPLEECRAMLQGIISYICQKKSWEKIRQGGYMKQEKLTKPVQCIKEIHKAPILYSFMIGFIS